MLRVPPDPGNQRRHWDPSSAFEREGGAGLGPPWSHAVLGAAWRSAASWGRGAALRPRSLLSRCVVQPPPPSPCVCPAQPARHHPSVLPGTDTPAQPPAPSAPQPRGVGTAGDALGTLPAPQCGDSLGCFRDTASPMAWGQLRMLWGHCQPGCVLPTPWLSLRRGAVGQCCVCGWSSLLGCALRGDNLRRPD